MVIKSNKFGIDTTLPIKKIKDATTVLLKYCRKNDWAGYDPYDGLNSRIFDVLPLSKSRISRIAFIQIVKRIPINIRKFLLVSKKQNPKALGLFISAFIKLAKTGIYKKQGVVEEIANKLIALRSQNSEYWCWGYSFPWQTRTVLVHRNAPNIVCTIFAANALLDAYEYNHEQRYLEMAASASKYLINDLYWENGVSVSSFAYPLPTNNAKVHNANFLGAALLCRTYKHTGENQLIKKALKVARYSAEKQNKDGSWNYGERSNQHWIDNFHTGFNLCALNSICNYADTTEFKPHLQRGYEFYRNNFFRDDGAPKYYHNRTYPIDIHSVAQSIITHTELKDLEVNSISLANSVFNWAMTNMWHEEGYFYYQILPHYKIKIPYMRWSEAWMLLALSTLLEASLDRNKINQIHECQTIK